MRAREHLTRRRIIAGLVAAGVVAGIVLIARPDPVEVDVAEARVATVRVTVAAEGKARVRNRFTVAAPVSGRLQRIAHVEGAYVRAGDVVAVLAPAPLDGPATIQARARLDAARAQLAEAEERVRVAEAGARQALRDVDRARMLHRAGAMALRTREETELEARTRTGDAATARLRASAAAAAVREAAAALMHDRTVGGGEVAVRAPTGGRVLHVPDRSERVVAAGTPLMELGDVGGLEVVADVLSNDAARIRPGMRVAFTDWAGDETAVGAVRLVEPAAVSKVSALGVEEQRVDVVIDVLGALAGLGDGYRVDVEIVVEERPSVLTVPPSALVRAGAGWAVFVAADGRARLTPLAVGAMSDAAVEVRDGLQRGARVIVFPSDRTRDGTRISVRS